MHCTASDGAIHQRFRLASDFRERGDEAAVLLYSDTGFHLNFAVQRGTASKVSLICSADLSDVKAKNADCKANIQQKNPSNDFPLTCPMNA